MRHQTQPLLRNKLSCLTAYSISLVLDAHKCGLEVLDELVLPLRELAGLLLGKLVGAIVLDRLERRCGVLDVVAAVVHNHPSQGVILFPGLVKHIIDDSAELFKFLITVTHLRRLGGNRVVFDYL